MIEFVSLSEASLSVQSFCKNQGQFLSLQKGMANSAAWQRGFSCPRSPHCTREQMVPLRKESPQLSPPHQTEASAECPAWDGGRGDAVQVETHLQCPHPSSGLAGSSPYALQHRGFPSWKQGPWARGGPAGICPHPVLPHTQPEGRGLCRSHLREADAGWAPGPQLAHRAFLLCTS